MKNIQFSSLASALVLLLLVTAGAAAQAPAPRTFTEKDREFALKYANETREEFVKQLTGLSDAQLNFRAAEGRWTIGEIAEHIIVVENALRGMIIDAGMKTPVPAAKDEYPRVNDQVIVLAITNRGQKFTAPEQVRPNGRWKTVPDLLANFESTRKATVDFMKNVKDDMRGRFVNIPMGKTDVFQGYLFIIGHSDRHLAQLREVKADPNYPAK